MVGFLAFVMILVFGVLALVGGLQWISARRDAPLPGGDAGRLDRIESALTSLEARLDDLQDQQRFLERLLADRPDSGALGPASDTRADDPEADSILFDTDEGEEVEGH